MKENINLREYLPQIYEELSHGVLLTSKADGKTNTMTIGWGTVGIEWGKPVFIAYVRTGRYTHELLEKNGEFTVNIPIGKCDRKPLGICGSRSGRNTDKLKEAGLTPLPGETVSVPAIKEFPLTLECKVVYKQTQDISALKTEYRESCYPANVSSEAVGANSDPHTAYYGEITAAYIIK